MSCRRQCYFAAALAVMVTAAGAAGLDTNLVARLDVIDMELRAHQYAHQSEKTFLSSELVQERARPETDVGFIMQLEANIESSRARVRKQIGALWAQRNAVLKAAGLTPGRCEIHGVPLVVGAFEIAYGPTGVFPDGYAKARAAQFRNAGTPIPGGDAKPPDAPNALRVLHCPQCEKARAAWMRAQPDTLGF